MKRYWHLFWYFRKMRLMQLFEYRRSFFFWMSVSLAWTAFNLIFFDILVSIRGSIGGWNKPELFVLLGFYTTLDSLTWGFFYKNMWQYTRSIFEGTLSGYLLKPISTLFIVTTQDNSYTNIPRLLIGLITLVVAASHLPTQPTAMGILLATGFFFTAALFVYSLWFGMATIAFWVEKLDNINEIIPAMRHIFRVPRTVFTGISPLILTILTPILLTTSFPAELLLGRADWRMGVVFILTTLATSLGSYLFFRFSIKKFVAVGG